MHFKPYLKLVRDYQQKGVVEKVHNHHALGAIHPLVHVPDVHIYLSGIHIRSRPVVPDNCNLERTIEITPKVVLWTGGVFLNLKISLKNSYMIYCVHFTYVLITTHLLKTFRITEINMQLLYGMKS